VSRTYQEAEGFAKKLCSRDPFDLLDSIGARIKFNYEYQPDGLQGYANIIRRVKFAVINGNLKNDYRHIVAGHEAAHLIKHQVGNTQFPLVGLA